MKGKILKEPSLQENLELNELILVNMYYDYFLFLNKNIILFDFLILKCQ